MAKRIPKLEEHERLGSDLFAAQVSALNARKFTAEAYGGKSDVYRASVKAWKALLDLRSKLDDRVCSENPSESTAKVCGVYFPGPNGRSRDPLNEDPTP